MATLHQIRKRAERIGIFREPAKIAIIDDMGGYYECTIAIMDTTARENDVTRHRTEKEALLYAENHADIVIHKDYGDDGDGQAQNIP